MNEFLSFQMILIILYQPHELFHCFFLQCLAVRCFLFEVHRLKNMMIRLIRKTAEWSKVTIMLFITNRIFYIVDIKSSLKQILQVCCLPNLRFRMHQEYSHRRSMQNNITMSDCRYTKYWCLYF